MAGFPIIESRLPRDAQGKVLPPVRFTPDGERIELLWPGVSATSPE
jgi:hypothetical protein